MSQDSDPSLDDALARIRDLETKSRFWKLWVFAIVSLSSTSLAAVMAGFFYLGGEVEIWKQIKTIHTSNDGLGHQSVIEDAKDQIFGPFNYISYGDKFKLVAVYDGVRRNVEIERRRIIDSESSELHLTVSPDNRPDSSVRTWQLIPVRD